MKADRIVQGKQQLQRYRRRKSTGPKIAFFTGGTGSRFLAQRMLTYTHNASYIINTSDSGGSTRQLRLLFNMPAIGDFRSRLIDLASVKTKGYKQTSELLKRRLKKDTSPGELEKELHDIIIGSDPMVKAIKEVNPNFSKMLTHNLLEFQKYRLIYERQTGRSFDLAGASIGNLFLTGAYLYYGKDLELPIYLYKHLAGVKGDVVPATLETVNLAAEMADQSTIVGQHLITHADNGPVDNIWYVDREATDARRVYPAANPRALDAIREAKLLVFSMGSFYTSILSTLQLRGIAEAIRKNPAPKVFVANSREDEETVGMTVGSMAHEIVKVLRENDSISGVNSQYLTHVVANRFSGQAVLFKGQYRYFPPDLVSLPKGIMSDQVSLLEKAGSSYYDPYRVSALLFSFID